MSDPLKTSTSKSTEETSARSCETDKGEKSTSTAAVPSGTASITKGTRGIAPDANLTDASHDWILKSSAYKGSHNVVWPDPLDSSPTPSLTTGLTNEV